MECAVWFRSNGIAQVQVCNDELAGLQFAHSLDAGPGAAIGVQFPDGRFFPLKTWSAYIRAGIERDKPRDETPRPRPTRNVRSPFSADTAVVPVDAPLWVGR